MRLYTTIYCGKFDVYLPSVPPGLLYIRWNAGCFFTDKLCKRCVEIMVPTKLNLFGKFLKRLFWLAFKIGRNITFYILMLKSKNIFFLHYSSIIFVVETCLMLIYCKFIATYCQIIRGNAVPLRFIHLCCVLLSKLVCPSQ